MQFSHFSSVCQFQNWDLNNAASKPVFREVSIPPVSLTASLLLYEKMQVNLFRKQIITFMLSVLTCQNKDM